MGYKTGRETKTYYSTNGIGGTPTWVQLTLVRNPQLDLSGDEAEVDDQSSEYTRYKVGQFKAPLTLEITRKVGQAGYLALRNAFLTRAIIGIAFCSGDMATEGEEVWMCDYVVTAFPVGGGLSDTHVVSVKLQPAADSANAPSFSDVEAA